ncbi:patatin family protein [Pasteurellaceae bacterium 15-036681]|nr:patatin family protein [Pasteurellaceae bacterium 15-036681]
MKIGLVLEGGAMRGMYTAGVLDTFLDENILVDGIISVSAGALFGVNYLSKQKGRAIRYNKALINDDRYISFKNLIKTGNIIDKEFAFYEVPFTIDVFDNEAYKQSPIDFYVTITNMHTAQAEYVKLTDPFKQMEVLRATSAMPYVSKPVEIDGHEYLDGAIADSIPLEQMQKMGYDKIIVVLTRPLEYRKSKPLPIISKLYYRNYPKFAEAVNNRYAMYNDQVENVIKQGEKGEIFVIRPSKDLEIKRIEKDVNKLQEMYELGITDTQQQLADLRKYLSLE